MHEVVKLLLARMKSHPEEFAAGSSRWGWMVTDAMESGSDEERAALKAGLRPIRLQEVHEFVLDELCNGEERRRKEQEEYEHKRQMVIQQPMQGMGISNIAPSQKLTIGAACNEAMRIQTDGELHLGGEKLDAGMIRKMKKALGV